MPLLALTSSLLGVLLLRLAWRQPRRAALRYGGWLLLAVSAYAWSSTVGPEFGMTFSLAALAFAAWLLVGVGAERRGASRKAERASAGPSLAETTALHKVGTFAAAGPLAAIGTALITIAAVRLLPMSSGGQLAVAALLYPVLWGIAAYGLCTGSRLLRGTAVLAVLSALSGLIVWLGW